MSKVLKVRRVESVCIEEDTLIFEVNLFEDNDMLDDDDDVDKRARTPRQPPPLPAKTRSIRWKRGEESAKKSKFTVPNSFFGIFFRKWDGKEKKKRKEKKGKEEERREERREEGREGREGRR